MIRLFAIVNKDGEVVAEAALCSEHYGLPDQRAAAELHVDAGEWPDWQKLRCDDDERDAAGNWLVDYPSAPGTACRVCGYVAEAGA